MKSVMFKVPIFTGMALSLLLGHAFAESSQPARLAPQSLLLDVARTEASLVAVGERGHVLRSTDQGTSWQQVIVPTRALLTAVTFADDVHGWAVGQNATILATADGGSTWALQFDAGQLPEADTAQDAPLLAISCINKSSCVASGAYGLFLHTQDGGKNWERRYVKESDSNFYAIRMLDEQRFVIAGESGSILTSDAAGDEWISLTPPYFGSFFGFLLLPDNAWLLYGLRGHILRSEDQGTSWQNIETGVDSGLMGGRILADGRIAVVGAGGVVLVSSDNARSFTLQRQSTRTALSTVIDRADGQLLLFGEKGIQPVEGIE